MRERNRREIDVGRTDVHGLGDVRGVVNEMRLVGDHRARAARGAGRHLQHDGLACRVSAPVGARTRPDGHQGEAGRERMVRDDAVRDSVGWNDGRVGAKARAGGQCLVETAVAVEQQYGRVGVEDGEQQGEERRSIAHSGDETRPSGETAPRQRVADAASIGRQLSPGQRAAGGRIVDGRTIGGLAGESAERFGNRARHRGRSREV